MTAPIATFNLSATVSSVSGPIAIGDVVVPIGTDFYKATTANLATAAKRAQGVAMTAWSANTTGSVIVQNVGVIDTLSTGLGAGAASWVRVSTAGRLERATVSGTDDVVGWCAADGTLFALFGLLTAAIVNGGGSGFTPPTGTGFVSVTGGSLDAASIKVNLASTTYVTGTLPAGNGGTGLTALGTNVATFLGSVLAAGYVTFAVTPSGANLASLLTSALPVAKGGTGLTALTIPASALLVGTTDSQTLTNKTLTDPIVSTSRINNATAGGTINDVTLSGTAGTFRRVFFTNASGPTVTGFDATGIADGTILRVFATGGSISFNNEAAGSLAANRITIPGGIATTLGAGGYYDLEYDLTNARWRGPGSTAI